MAFVVVYVSLFFVAYRGTGIAEICWARHVYRFFGKRSSHISVFTCNCHKKSYVCNLPIFFPDADTTECGKGGWELVEVTIDAMENNE